MLFFVASPRELSHALPASLALTQAVATLNRATSNPTVTSHADLNYPFCEPSSRASSTMDYYHLLLTGVCTPNKSQVGREDAALSPAPKSPPLALTRAGCAALLLLQVFTTFGMQLPGQYLRHGDMSLPLGPIVTAVYRSWAFKQKATVEEFVTDDGQQPATNKHRMLAIDPPLTHLPPPHPARSLSCLPVVLCRCAVLVRPADERDVLGEAAHAGRAAVGQGGRHRWGTAGAPAQTGRGG